MTLSDLISQTLELDAEALQAAMAKDFEQECINQLTPDRGYPFPIDHTAALLSNQSCLARALKIAVEAIEDAPHGQDCYPGVSLLTGESSQCRCWKSRALAAIDSAIATKGAE